LRRIAKRVPGGLPATLPPEDSKARDAEAGERRPHEVRHDAQIFGNDLGTGLQEDCQRLLPERDLFGLEGRREERLAAILWPRIRSIEPDEMIDPVSIVERGAAAGALAEPLIIPRRDDVPPVDRHSPILARGAECVR